MKKLKFAIIGCGRISYKQIQGLGSNNNEATLVAVCDINDNNMNLAIDKYNQITSTSHTIAKYVNYKEMLVEEELDGVIISTESGLHEEMALFCIERGKHVLIEKPLALSIAGAEKIIAASKQANVKVGVCHQNRFNEPIQALKKAITENRLGKIYNCTARILWSRNMDYYQQAPWRGTWRLDGGTLMNQCIHNIDLLNWMIDDEVDTVYAQIANFKRDIEAEDFGAIIIRYKNGAIGMIEGTALTYPKNLEETLSITGETGTVVVGGIAVNKIDTWHVKGDDNSKYENINSGDAKSVYGHGHIELFKNFVDAIKKGSPILADAQAGMIVMKIILAAYASQKTGQVIKFSEFKEFSTLDMENHHIKVR